MNADAKKFTSSLSDRKSMNENVYLQRRPQTSPKERLNQAQRAQVLNNEMIQRKGLYKSNLPNHDLMPHYGPPVMYHVNQIEQYPKYPFYLPNYPNYSMPLSHQNSYYVPLPSTPDYYQYDEYYVQDEINDPQETVSQEEYEYYSTDYETIIPGINDYEQLRNHKNESMKTYAARRISRGSQTYLTDKVNLNVNKNPAEYVETEIYKEQQDVGMITVATQTPDVKRILDALTAETKNIASRTNKVQDYDTIMKKINKYFTNSIGSHLEVTKEQVSRKKKRIR